MQNYDYLAPVWSGDTAYNESFLPLEEKNAKAGGVLRIPLLYRADKIERVTDASLERVFEDGRDYILSGGELTLPENSRIRTMKWDEYNTADPGPHGFRCAGGGYLKFGEGAGFHLFQYCVTYSHSDRWTGYIPSSDPSKLPSFKRALAGKRPLTVGFSGDSITTGANSSGKEGVNVPPNLPIWPVMVCGALSGRYGAEVSCVNRSVGGMSSDWGAKMAKEHFKDTPLDLCVIAFGMNDATGNVPPQTVADNYDRIASAVSEMYPGCEFIFVSTSLPNPVAEQFCKTQGEQEELLMKLADKYGAGADTARVTAVHKYLLSKKRYYDMTGNNINHPNDYLARVYAQTILSLFA